MVNRSECMLPPLRWYSCLLVVTDFNICVMWYFVYISDQSEWIYYVQSDWLMKPPASWLNLGKSVLHAWGSGLVLHVWSKKSDITSTIVILPAFVVLRLNIFYVGIISTTLEMWQLWRIIIEKSMWETFFLSHWNQRGVHLFVETKANNEIQLQVDTMANLPKFIHKSSMQAGLKIPNKWPNHRMRDIKFWILLVIWPISLPSPGLGMLPTICRAHVTRQDRWIGQTTPWGSIDFIMNC